MSHTEAVFAGTGSIIKATFLTNIMPKAFASFFMVVYGLIAHGNETIIGMIMLLYIIDLTTGVAAALYRKEWESRKFFMGCTKLLVYGIFMVIGVSIGETLNLGNILLSSIFAFIIITDSSSIIENLDKLGYATPIFLKKYLKSAQESVGVKINIK